MGDVPEEHEDMMEQLNGFRHKFHIGRVEIIADSMKFAKDPYLLYHISCRKVKD